MALQSRGQEACLTLRFGSLEFLKVELNSCSLDPVLWWVGRMLAWVAGGGVGALTCVSNPQEYAVWVGVLKFIFPF